MSSRPSRGAARLAAILDALPDGLLLVNCNGTVVNANTVALGMLEAPGTGLVGRGVLDLLPTFDSKLIPGSMRRPESEDDQGRTKPTRMIARRTDGTEFPVEVTSANLEDGRDAYASYGSGGGPGSYSGDELLMLVVRDLSGTVDTEAELARSQRQTEMILRAAAEGVVGTDTDGRVVLVNPAAAQILGYRASDLGGQELHPLVLHSREDGEPFPYEGSPLADTLKSGRKHRVRGQVIWTKNGTQVPVDLTTAPVRDGDLLVGAVMTFTDRRPYEEQAAKHAEVLERETARYDALAARHQQLLSVLAGSLRGPIDELRAELSALAADDAGQLWPEANQVLHHLAAGYSRITTLVDNVLGYQRLDAGSEELKKAKVLVDSVVGAGVDGAVELIGPGRAQFAVHTPPIEAEIDAPRLATALAHLIADVAGVDATGKAPVAAGGYMDSTVVVAAAVRGEVVRIEVRGPYAGGDPVHGPIVRGIVKAHGGVLQTVDVPGMSGSAYVLEVPLGAGAGTVEAPAAPQPDEALLPAQQDGGGRRRARRASTDAFLESPVSEEKSPTGRRRARAGVGSESESGSGDGSPAGSGSDGAGEGDGPDGERARIPGQQNTGTGGLTESVEGAGVRASASGSGGAAAGPSGSGRRRGRPSPAEQAVGRAAGQPLGQAAEGSVVTGAESARESSGMGRAALGETVPPQGVPTEATGRRARRALPAPASSEAPPAAPSSGPAENAAEPTGRRARRALGAAPAGGSAANGQEGSVRTAFALPPADADRAPRPAPVSPNPTSIPTPTPTPDTAADAAAQGRLGFVPSAGSARTVEEAGQVGAGHVGAGHMGLAEHMGAGPVGAGAMDVEPTGARAMGAGPMGASPMGAEPTGAGHMGAAPAGSTGAHPTPAGPGPNTATRNNPAPGDPVADHTPPQPHPAEQPEWAARAVPVPGAAGPVPPQNQNEAQADQPQNQPAPKSAPARPARQPLPAETPPGGIPVVGGDTQGRAFSVRALGQNAPFSQTQAQTSAQTSAQMSGQPSGQTSGGSLGSGRRRKLGTPPEGVERPAEPAARPHPVLPSPPSEGRGRAYAIGAPDEGAEGPEPLDGPGGAVEVANRPQPQPVDDELPPEPLDNPRRLLVWPAPDVSTQQALSERGYRPVVVHSREEVDAQIAAFPAALFVDPLTGPITRTALQSLRQAAVAAEVPVLVTAGLGQATREAAYGADPAVLLKALAPRDSEQHPSRVLLIEEHEEIALALTATLERRGMQVARAGTDSEAVTLAAQMRPNLVVMDLMQVRRRRAGIVDWLRANGQLNHTPLVVYTSAGINQAELPKLSSGETVLFLAERSTSGEVQGRIVDLLAKIGTN
ncbi:PAS domain-containing protein [Streptomyces sp. NBC_00212]|uniref:PAS domain-containing protein n=1 Tax=Streptomyces sp. NBC_00212 TaxID=2975684 RepID=UPI00325646AC